MEGPGGGEAESGEFLRWVSGGWAEGGLGKRPTEKRDTIVGCGGIQRLLRGVDCYWYSR